MGRNRIPNRKVTVAFRMLPDVFAKLKALSNATGIKTAEIVWKCLTTESTLDKF